MVKPDQSKPQNPSDESML